MKTILIKAQMKNYKSLISGISTLLTEARMASVKSVNSILTATYWNIGRRIIEFEQGGKASAKYGEEVIERLSKDLTRVFGRGFSQRNLFQMRLFYLIYPERVQTLSAKLDSFPLSWSHYVHLLSITDQNVRNFYEQEAIRGGWSVRQLDRQISTQFYERALLSKNKATFLKKETRPKKADIIIPEEELTQELKRAREELKKLARKDF